MVENIRTHTNNCTICAQANPPNVNYGAAGLIEPSDHPMESLSLDVMGPYVTSSRGHSFILVLILDFAKYVWTAAAPSQTSRRLRVFLEGEWSLFGLPKTLRTDNGKPMVSGQFEAYLSQRGIKHLLATPYNPEGNGLVERANRTLGYTLR